MKITKRQLRQIIKEEKDKLLKESMGDDYAAMGNFDQQSVAVQLTPLQIDFIRHCAGAYVEVGLDDILGEYPSDEQMNEILELVNIGN